MQRKGEPLFDHGCERLTYDEQCIKKEDVIGLKYRPGDRVSFRAAYRDDSRKLRTVGTVVEDFDLFTLVRVDTPCGPYNIAINKIDILAHDYEMETL